MNPRLKAGQTGMGMETGMETEMETGTATGRWCLQDHTLVCGNRPARHHIPSVGRELGECCLHNLSQYRHMTHLSIYTLAQ